MRTLLFSLENANKWINKIELKLSNPDNILEQSNLDNLSLNIQRIVNDLNVSVVVVVVVIIIIIVVIIIIV